MPAFTAGGNREAEIATPTRLPVFPPKIDKLTPIPDGIAMAIPVYKPSTSPRICISLVGQSSALSVNPAVKAMETPTKIQIPRAYISTLNEDRASGQSRIRPPKVIPRTGPMMGDTSIDATITTVLLVANPTPASILAIITRAIKSKEKAACSTICSRTCSILKRVAAFIHSAFAASISRSFLISVVDFPDNDFAATPLFSDASLFLIGGISN
mmetsp:Transcript_880/g.1641  ORF Transcript_880/g.1641 Transcript_880/m.1641 type:complete len:213 (-) Transcript_880:1057-1695(-)